MRLLRLVTLLIAVRFLMIVPRLMLSGVRSRVMCLVQSQTCSSSLFFWSDPMGKVELLSAWFDSKQSRDIVDQVAADLSSKTGILWDCLQST